MKFTAFLNLLYNWLANIPERALTEAYHQALKIKDIEDKYFNGKPVLANKDSWGENTFNYSHKEINRYFQKIHFKLLEFKTSEFLINLTNLKPNSSDSLIISQQNVFLEKLIKIQQTVSPYQNKFTNIFYSNFFFTDININLLKSEPNKMFQKKSANKQNQQDNKIDNSASEKLAKKSGLLPRSFLDTINRIKQEVDSKPQETEEEIVKKYRSSRYKTATSIKFILLLIIIPLLTHQVTKNFFIAPIVDRYFDNHSSKILFINMDLQEEAFEELETFERSLHFKTLIGLIPEMSPEEIEEKVKEKADEIAEEYRGFGADAVSNVFADICSIIAFGFLIGTGKNELAILKSFFDEIFYNLSDSAKAFIIILLTDTFVGFHSPHGWEVILEGISRHFGLPENREFNYLFIATFPVILDTILKYWIFRYLNRISPSSVATYRNMNE